LNFYLSVFFCSGFWNISLPAYSSLSVMRRQLSTVLSLSSGMDGDEVGVICMEREQQADFDELQRQEDQREREQFGARIDQDDEAHDGEFDDGGDDDESADDQGSEKSAGEEEDFDESRSEEEEEFDHHAAGHWHGKGSIHHPSFARPSKF